MQPKRVPRTTRTKGMKIPVLPDVPMLQEVLDATKRATIGGVESRTSKASIEPMSKKDAEYVGIHVLRNLAATTYITDQLGVSLREMSETPPYNAVSLITLERWCLEDSWVERRRQFGQNIQRQVETKIASSLIQSRLSMVKKSERIMQNLEMEIPTLEAKSKEQAIAAYVKIMEIYNSMIEKLASEVTPELNPNMPRATGKKIDVPIDLLRKGAKAMIRANTERLRQKLQAQEQVEDEVEAEVDLLEDDNELE